MVLLPPTSPQDISFFDAPENSSGALLSALASDAASVRGAVGDRVGHILTLLSCVVGSYVIAFKSRCGDAGWQGAGSPLSAGAAPAPSKYSTSAPCGSLVHDSDAPDLFPP